MSYDCTANFFRCSVNTANETSSVMMTSLDIGLFELYVDDGFSLANRNRACVQTKIRSHEAC